MVLGFSEVVSLIEARVKRFLSQNQIKFKYVVIALNCCQVISQLKHKREQFYYISESNLTCHALMIMSAAENTNPSLFLSFQWFSIS